MAQFLSKPVEPISTSPGDLPDKYRRGNFPIRDTYLSLSLHDEYKLDGDSIRHHSLNDRSSRSEKRANDKLREKYDPKYLVAIVRVLKEPEPTEDQLRRLRRFWKLLQGVPEFSIDALKEHFFTVNHILFKGNWFSSVEAWKSRNLATFMQYSIEMPHAWTPNSTNLPRRKSDNLFHTIENYKLICSVLCGVERMRSNRFVAFIDQYYSDLARNGGVRRAPFKEKKKGKTFRKESKRDRKIAAGDGDVVHSFQAQMHGVSAIINNLTTSAIQSAKPAIVDGMWSVVQDFLASIPKKLTELMTNAYQGGLKLISEVTKWLGDQFQALLVIVKELITTICEVVVAHAALFGIALFLFLIMLYVHRKELGRVYSFLGFALHKLSLRNGFKPSDITEYLKPWEYQQFTAQSLTGIAAIAGSAISIVFALTDKNALQGANGVVSFVSRLPQVCTSVEDAIKECLDFLYFKSSGKHLFESKGQLDEFREFIDDYNQLAKDPNLERNVMQDFCMTTKLEKLYRRQQNIRDYVHLLKLDPAMSQALAKAMSRVEVLYQKARVHADYYKTRIETPLLWLKGDSGQGKTSVYPHIVAGVYKRVQKAHPDLFETEFSLGMIHSRDKTSDFWEGYNQHFCCVWNEVFEKTEAAERAKTATELLTACEDGAYPLNMAFEQKGMAFFNSYLAIVTCNLHDTQLKQIGMTFPKALVRRQTLNLQVNRRGHFDSKDPNFDDAWDFVLYYPEEQEYRESFELGVPEPYLSLAKAKGGTVLTYSEVVNCLADQILARLVNRTDKASLLRTFDYCSYVERNSFINHSTGISVTGKPSRDDDFLKKYQGKNFQPQQKPITNVQKVSLRKPVRKTRKAFDFPVPKTQAAEAAHVAIATAASVETGKEKVREKPIPPPKPRGRSTSPKFDAQMFQPNRSYSKKCKHSYAEAMEIEREKLLNQSSLTDQLISSFNVAASKATDKIEDFAEHSNEFLQGLKGRHCENNYWNEGDEGSVFMGETFMDTTDHRFWEKAPCEQTKAILGIPKKYRFTREVIEPLAQLPWTLGHLILNKIDSLLWSEKADERRKAFRALKFWSITMTGDWLMTTLSLQAMALLLDVTYIQLMEFHLSSFEFIPLILKDSFKEGDVCAYNSATNPLTKSLICRVFFEELLNNVPLSGTYIGTCYRLVKVFVKDNPLPEGTFYGTEDFRRIKTILRNDIDSFHESKDKSWMQTGVRLRTCWDGLYSKIHQNWVAFSYLSGMLAALVVASTATYMLTKEDQTPYTSKAVFEDVQVKRCVANTWRYDVDGLHHSMVFDQHPCYRKGCNRDIVVGAEVAGCERFYCARHAPSWYKHCENNVDPGSFRDWCNEKSPPNEVTPLPGVVGVQTQSLGKGNHSRVPGRPGMKPQSLGHGNHSRVPGKPGLTPHSLGSGNHSRVPGKPGMKPQYSVERRHRIATGNSYESQVQFETGCAYCDRMGMHDCECEPGFFGCDICERKGFVTHTNVQGETYNFCHSCDPLPKTNSPIDMVTWSNVVDPLFFMAQSHVDGMVDHSFISISSNFRELEFHYPQRGIAVSVRCLFSGRRALTIGHFFDVYGLGFNKVLVKNGDVTIHTFPSTQVRVSSRGEGRDLWSVDFPNHMNAMSSLNGKLYATKEDMLRHMSLSTQFERLHRTYKNGTTIIQSVAAKSVTMSINPVSKASNLTTSYFLQGHYIMMGTYGNPGDCALPYVHKDDSGATKIVGLHVGLGGESNGYCSPIFQHDFTDDNFNVQCAEAPAWLKMVDSPPEPQTCDKQTVFMGIIDTPAYIPGKTEYVASPAQGDTDTDPLYPITTAPAVLNVTTWETGDTVEPLKLAMEKLNNAHVRPLPDWMIGATLEDIDTLTEGFFPKGMDRTKIVPWTMMEVLFGKSGTSWTGLRKDSSIGPDVKRFIPGVTSRDQLWGVKNGKQWVHSLFVKLIVDICKIVKSGNEPKNVVEGCLKDEPRTIDRVLAGKTRLFCVGSLSHLVWTIMWMGGLVTEMKNHRDKSDVSIGTNVHGFDWKLIYNNLHSMHDSVHGAGDVSGMDTSERAWWGWILAEACSRFYNFDKGSYEDNSIRYACQSSLCPILIIGRNVYWMDYFNSSGGWLTGFLNSFVSVVIFNVAVIIVQFQNKEKDPVFANLSVREFLRRAFYGDDNAWSILKKYAKYLDMSILAKIYMEVFGIDYTTPGKGKITEKFLEFSEIDYLARRFRLQGNAVFAPLSEDSIYSMLHWIKKPKAQIIDGVRVRLTLDEQWLINVETACQEWFHYGSERFEKETSHMRARVRMLGLPWPGKSYDEYLYRWTNGLQPLASVQG